ncbi:MAG TPA: hypothetical protein DCG19_05560 [Cryomorphaceae bacterium]|nr:hypothetical protein [Owenweeksia sp.]MBG00293.1 hypothetical protein [Owenweeksia sp.]HAD96852.1 hypothetical protein [Cryomorphaceae bacterium]HBF21656.1 hypothetical protein [Cryomorphaceae bacterium]|tara:strand:- start:5581 stop:6495 length:915 start_codon:yes stop_codon:yes gene_type:complete
MIRYVKHAFINRDKYDQCIKLDRSELMYGMSWYLDTVCENWDALVLNDYDAVWPLPVRSKMGVTYFYRPFGVQQLGVFSRREVTQSLLDDFVKALVKNCRYADVFLNDTQPWTSQIPKCEWTSNSNYVLDINTSYEELYEGYSTNLKRNIRKAQKNNWQLFEHDDPTCLTSLFKDDRQDELKLPQPFYKTVERLMFTCLHRSCGHIWTLYGQGNQLEAGIFVTEFGNRLTLLFTGNSEAGRQHQAMAWLINEFIILHSSKGKRLDFEGSNNAGLARFYKSFGSELYPYQNLKYNGLPVFLKWLK